MIIEFDDMDEYLDAIAKYAKISEVRFYCVDVPDIDAHTIAGAFEFRFRFSSSDEDAIARLEGRLSATQHVRAVGYIGNDSL